MIFTKAIAFSNHLVELVLLLLKRRKQTLIGWVAAQNLQCISKLYTICQVIFKIECLVIVQTACSRLKLIDSLVTLDILTGTLVVIVIVVVAFIILGRRAVFVLTNKKLRVFTGGRTLDFIFVLQAELRIRQVLTTAVRITPISI